MKTHLSFNAQWLLPAPAMEKSLGATNRTYYTNVATADSNHAVKHDRNLKVYWLEFLFIFLITYLISSLNPAFATTYTVATNGNDGAAGTLAAPLRTIKAGFSKAVAGDTIQVRSGTYTEEIIVRKSGTAAAPIKLVAYPGESPIIDGNNTLPGQYGALVYFGGNYLQVSGFEIRNSLNYGVHFEGKYDVAQNLNVHHTYQNGILARGDYGLVENCRVWQTARSNYNNAEAATGMWASALSAARDPENGITEGAILRGNTVYDNWGEGLSTYEARGTVLDGNIVYDNFSAQVYISDASDTVAQKNLVYATANSNTLFGRPAPGIVMANETTKNPLNNVSVINNIVYATSAPLMYTSNVGTNSMSNTLIANNTFVNGTAGRLNGTPTTVIFRSGAFTNVRFSNNIVMQEDSYPVISISSSQTGITFNSNLWSKAPASTAAAWNDVVGNALLAKTGSTAAGALSGDWFKLQSSSPAKARATVISTLLDDYFSGTRDSAPDIGAHESDGVATAPPTTTPPVTTAPVTETNLALNKPATVSSVETAQFAGSNAFDGKLTTRWSSLRTDPQWIYVDLGATYQVNRVKLIWEAAYSKSYRVEVSSDKVNWTTIYNTAAGAGGTQDLTGLSGIGQYVRMYGLARGTTYGHSLWEMEVYGTPSTALPASTNLALNKTATVSSIENTQFPAKYAFDGNLKTRWSSQRIDPQWIRVDLGAIYNISRVKLVWEAAYATSYKMQVSNDGVAWTDIYITTKGVGGTVDLTSVTGVGRYVRMYGTGRGTTYGYSLWEMEVYGTPWK